jgi:hypothetical protein
VPKYGGEKALTKRLHEEVAPKLRISLDEVTKLDADPVKLLQSPSLAIGGPCRSSAAKSVHGLDAEPKLVTLSKTKTRQVSLKSRLEKIMHKLYDLEPDSAPEKPLNVNLDVDLYQMEGW